MSEDESEVEVKVEMLKIEFLKEKKIIEIFTLMNSEF
jgi:hypothetical protein